MMREVYPIHFDAIYQLKILTRSDFLHLTQKMVHGLYLIICHYNHNSPLSIHVLKAPPLLLCSSLKIKNHIRNLVSSAVNKIEL